MTQFSDDFWHTDAGVPLVEISAEDSGGGATPAMSIESAVERFLALCRRFEASQPTAPARSAGSQEQIRLREAFLEHGRGLSEMGPEFAELALDAFTYAVSVDAASAEARIERANALLDLGRTAEALAESEFALSLAPSELPTLLTAAAARACAGHVTEALQLEARALSAANALALPGGAREQIEGFFASLRSPESFGPMTGPEARGPRHRERK